MFQNYIFISIDFLINKLQAVIYVKISQTLFDKNILKIILVGAC